jgi:hypothetical protein
VLRVHSRVYYNEHGRQKVTHKGAGSGICETGGRVG